MDSSEQVSKKIKLSNEDQIILEQKTKQLIKNRIIQSLMEHVEKIIEPFIDSHTIGSDYKIDSELLMQINMCEAKEAFLQSNLDRFIKQKESLLTDNINQIIDESITSIKEQISKSLINL